MQQRDHEALAVFSVFFGIPSLKALPKLPEGSAPLESVRAARVDFAANDLQALILSGGGVV